MKKIVLILVLGIFAFGASGFDVNQTIFQENCDDSRAAIYAFAIHNGHDAETANNMANNYFVNCFQNGGYSILTRVFAPYFN